GACAGRGNRGLRLARRRRRARAANRGKLARHGSGEEGMKRLGVAVAAVLVSAIPAAAGPWLEAGDRQVRSDVELLKAAGLIRGPTNAWPLPWAQVAEGLERADGQPLLPHLAAAVRRLTIL